MVYLQRFVVPAISLGIALLLASCSFGSSESNPNLVALDAPRSATPQIANSASTRTETPRLISLAPFTEDDVFDAVSSFVDARDAAVAGTASLESLEGIVSDRVLAEVAAQRQANLTNLETYSVHARVAYTTFPYLLDVQRAGDSIAAVTCNERWSERRTGDHQVVFMDQAMIFDIVDDELVLAEVRTAHDGERATEGLTCFVGVLSERTVDAAQAGVEALEAISTNPDLATRTDYPSLFSAVALDSFADIANSADPSRRRITPVEVQYTPLGIDPSRGLDFVGAVSVCRRYPEGVYDEIIATGERVPVNAAYTPGTSVEDIVYVHIEPKRRSQGGIDRFWDFEADVSRDCWS